MQASTDDCLSTEAVGKLVRAAQRRASTATGLATAILTQFDGSDVACDWRRARLWRGAAGVCV